MHRKLKIANATLRSNKPLRSASRSWGFTLTEVVVASALLIIAVVPILKALTNSYLSTVTIERGTRCLILAQAKLDEIKARSIYHYNSSYTENNTSLDGSYLCNVSDTGSGSDLRTITVSVGFDLNGDSTLASDEIEIAISTRLTRRWNSG
jgi:Tfp pilus assembly protein PilV